MARLGAAGGHVPQSVEVQKKNPMATVMAGEGAPITILNRNQPAF